MKRVTRDKVCLRFSADDPTALVVRLGEAFVIETSDRFAEYTGPDSPEKVQALINTMNGPIYIEGASAGSTIRIEILAMIPGSEKGYVVAFPEVGPLGHLIPRFRKETVRIEGLSAIFENGVSIPLRPMLGRIGVAPKDGSAGLNSRGDFGGLLSNTDISEGSTLYLPVFHDGAFLAVGDSHAAMGDGEAASSALEAALDVTLRVSLEDRFQVSHPLVVTATHIMTTGWGPTMEEATQNAVKVMADLMMDRLAIDYTRAAMLIGCAADVRACLALSPPYTMKVAVPRSVLPI